MRTRTVVAGAIGLAAAMAGAAPLAGQMQHPGGGATGHQVTVNDVGYLPAEMVVAPGQQVIFDNVGVNPHTVTADDGASFDSGTVAPKAKFTLTAPAAKGIYAYHCTLHTFIRGTLTVSTLTLQGPRLVLIGKSATLRGVAPGMPAGTPVILESLVGGAWTQVGAGALGPDGSYSLTTPALRAGAELRARIGTEVSPTLEVPVAPKVSAKKAKTKLTLTVTLTPARAGKANLERLNTSTFKWAKVRQLSISARGKATVKVPRAGKYRVSTLAVPARGLASASSATLTFS